MKCQAHVQVRVLEVCVFRFLFVFLFFTAPPLDKNMLRILRQVSLCPSNCLYKGYTLPHKLAVKYDTTIHTSNTDTVQKSFKVNMHFFGCCLLPC